MLAIRRRLILPFVLPAVLVYTVFYVGPSLFSLYISLHNWSGFTDPMVWLGGRNYLAMLEDPVFWKSFWNTMQVLFVVGGLVFLLGFVFTVVIREMRGRGFIRAVIFFPNIVAPVALAILWGFMLDPNFGLINMMLRSFGLEVLARPWMAPDLIFKSIMLALIWIYTGFYTTIILAGVDKIPAYFYEAADVEGAGPLAKFIHVTLPMTWDVISVAGVLWVINAIKMFEFIYAFSGVGDAPPTHVWTLAVNMFIISFGNRTPIYRLGYGSAIAVSMVFMVALAVLLLRRVMHRDAIEY